jgi:pimeloyl-ACP methyl ester carboxylesterase
MLTTSDGVGINYVERGEGQPLLIIPGWGMSTRWFERQLESLSAHFRVNARYLAERIAGARLELFEHSAHCPFLEEGERFDAVVTEFAGAAEVR